MSKSIHFNSSKFLTVSVFLICFLFASLSDACFIRNCPKGGKRSLETALTPKRECMKCGLGGLGQCIGPNICCGPHFGCHIKTPEAEVCQQENQSLTPCSISGDVCGERDSGNCAADGICCDSEACALNEKCSRKSKKMEGKTTRSHVLTLLQKLLLVKD